MRLIVAGSRDWADAGEVNFQVTRFLEITKDRPITLVHGACPTGPDEMASRLTKLCPDLFVEEKHPADWDHCDQSCKPGHRVMKKPGDIVHPGKLDDYCPSAGPRRNRLMAALGADYCLAFLKPCSTCTRNDHPSHGTSDLLRNASRYRIPYAKFYG